MGRKERAAEARDKLANEGSVFLWHRQLKERRIRVDGKRRAADRKLLEAALLKASGVQPEYEKEAAAVQSVEAPGTATSVMSERSRTRGTALRTGTKPQTSATRARSALGMDETALSDIDGFDRSGCGGGIQDIRTLSRGSVLRRESGGGARAKTSQGVRFDSEPPRHPGYDGNSTLPRDKQKAKNAVGYSCSRMDFRGLDLYGGSVGKYIDHEAVGSRFLPNKNWRSLLQSGGANPLANAEFAKEPLPRPRGKQSTVPQSPAVFNKTSTAEKDRIATPAALKAPSVPRAPTPQKLPGKFEKEEWQKTLAARASNGPTEITDRRAQAFQSKYGISPEHFAMRFGFPRLQVSTPSGAHEGELRNAQKAKLQKTRYEKNALSMVSPGEVVYGNSHVGGESLDKVRERLDGVEYKVDFDFLFSVPKLDYKGELKLKGSKN